MHTADLVISLRDFIRGVLDLDPVPTGLAIPKQGPARPSSTRAAKADGADSRGDKTGGGKTSGGDAMLGAGMGAGAGLGIGSTAPHADSEDTHD